MTNKYPILYRNEYPIGEIPSASDCKEPQRWVTTLPAQQPSMAPSPRRKPRRCDGIYTWENVHVVGMMNSKRVDRIFFQRKSGNI